jgi:hypothetical protein
MKGKCTLLSLHTFQLLLPHQHKSPLSGTSTVVCSWATDLPAKYTKILSTLSLKFRFLKEGSGVRQKHNCLGFCIYCGDSDYMFRPCLAIVRSQCWSHAQMRKNTIVCIQALYNGQRDLVCIHTIVFFLFCAWLQDCDLKMARHARNM